MVIMAIELQGLAMAEIITECQELAVAITVFREPGIQVLIEALEMVMLASGTEVRRELA